MPELPEVEVIRQGLGPLLAGRTMIRLIYDGKKLRLPVPEQKMRQWLEQIRIREITRRAKYLQIIMDNEAVLLIHLGMTGRLGLFRPEQIPDQHDHLIWPLDNGMELRFNDRRRFGLVQALAPGEESPLLLHLGPEPFSADFAPSYLLHQATGKSRPVKNFLMDNRIVVGIGNIYASEILHGAGIRPERPVAEISSTEWGAVIDCSRLILRQAIAAGGSTISDYLDASGKAGYFQLSLKVYGHEGKPCQRCGAAITRKVLAGRASFWCDRCQR